VFAVESRAEELKVQWLWIALFVGVCVAPWVVMGKLLRVALARSLFDGIGVWIGAALMTTPAVLLFTWIGMVILG
jgi:hypothetical protein